MMSNKKGPMKIFFLIIVLLAGYFAYQGASMHSKVSVEEAKFHALQQDYFSQAKSVRDSAAANSELNGMLVDIQNSPSELLRLKLVGVGKILLGIFFLLLGIMVALVSMPMRLSKLIKR